MKHTIKFLLSLILITYFLGCKDKSSTIIQPPDFSENYKFFPIKDGREWNYELTIVDSVQGRTVKIEELGRYSQDSQCINYYKKGILSSMAYWSNDNNKMGCCVDVTLIDYNQLGCAADSVLIYQKTNSNGWKFIHQYCKKQFATEVPNYDKIECIKTRQMIVYTNENSLEIINYFGYGVGLIFRQETNFDKSGKVTTRETRKLMSYNF
jgi:hypothetical protein